MFSTEISLDGKFTDGNILPFVGRLQSSPSSETICGSWCLRLRSSDYHNASSGRLAEDSLEGLLIPQRNVKDIEPNEEIERYLGLLKSSRKVDFFVV